MGKLLSANLIAATLALVAPAYAQVRVITGDTEHAYGTGGQLLDDGGAVGAGVQLGVKAAQRFAKGFCGGHDAFGHGPPPRIRVKTLELEEGSLRRALEGVAKP